MIIKKLFIIVLFASALYADSLFVSPSFYTTYGNYGSKNYSLSNSFFNTLQLPGSLYLITHYDNLQEKMYAADQSQYEFEYTQHTLLSGLMFESYPFYAKFHYAHYKGEFKDNLDYVSNDYTNLYNMELLMYQYPFDFGVSAVYLNQIGYKAQKVGQVTLRLEREFYPLFFISLKPSYSTLLDGRKLYSASLKMHYLLFPQVILKAGGFAGERAYYFDSDLLTIFNQDETQKFQLFGLAEYFPIPSLKLMAAYQYTKFTTFKVHYITAGIKYYGFL